MNSHSNGDDKNVIDAQFVEVRIILCPACRQRNRLLINPTGGESHRCANCGTLLIDQLITSAPATKAPKNGAQRETVITVIFFAVAGLTAFIHFGISKPQPPTPSAPEPQAAVPGPRPRPLTPEEIDAIDVGPEDRGFVATKPAPLLPDEKLAELKYSLKPRTPPSGTILKRFLYAGQGVLNVHNGTDRDALIKLRDVLSTSTSCSFFVKHRESATLNSVPDGDYEVLFASGTDWDGEAFQSEESFSKFVSPMTFKTSVRIDGQYERTTYSDNSLTLHTVPHGNARTKSVSKAEFMRR